MVRITKSNSALLVIDIVNFCCAPRFEKPSSLKKVRFMVPILNCFIKDYREKVNGNIIFINCVRWDKEHIAKNLVELYKDPKCDYSYDDKSGLAEEFYGVKPEEDDVVISKNSYDAFTNPELDKILKERKIKYLIVTGVYGDGCVHSTIQSGFSKGYNLLMLKDLIETTDDNTRQKLQSLLKRYTWPVMFGKTIGSKELFGFLN